MTEPVEQQIADYAAKMLPSLGLELVDVQFRREGHGWVLRIFIDGPDGVGLDDCSRVSREMGDYLDVEDVIEHAYHLEVSSPGAERPLKTLADFQRFTGRKVRVKMRFELDGREVYTGILHKVEDDHLIVVGEDERRFQLPLEQIGKARLAL